MHPLLKRILLHGGLTAALLAVIGFMFAELAGMWLSTAADRPAPPGAAPPEALRLRVPLMMAFWGFVFVAGCEAVLSRFRRPPAPAPERQPDEAEKLLNELLAQAEAKMALEAESQKAGGSDQLSVT